MCGSKFRQRFSQFIVLSTNRLVMRAPDALVQPNFMFCWRASFSTRLKQHKYIISIHFWSRNGDEDGNGVGWGGLRSRGECGKP